MESSSKITATEKALPSAGEADLVESRIAARLSGHVRDLKVVIQDNGVILRGQAHTYFAKQLAQHAAMDVTGLPVLANEIEVH